MGWMAYGDVPAAQRGGRSDDVKVGVNGGDGLGGEVAGLGGDSKGLSLLDGKLLRDLDVLGVGLGRTASEGLGRVGGPGKGALSRSGGEGDGCEAHDGRGIKGRL